MGAVAVTDPSYPNEAHSRGLFVPDKQHDKTQKHYPKHVQPPVPMWQLQRKAFMNGLVVWT